MNKGREPGREMVDVISVRAGHLVEFLNKGERSGFYARVLKHDKGATTVAPVKFGGLGDLRVQIVFIGKRDVVDFGNTVKPAHKREPIKNIAKTPHGPLVPGVGPYKY